MTEGNEEMPLWNQRSIEWIKSVSDQHPESKNEIEDFYINTVRNLINEFLKQNGLQGLFSQTERSPLCKSLETSIEESDLSPEIKETIRGVITEAARQLDQDTSWREAQILFREAFDELEYGGDFNTAHEKLTRARELSSGNRDIIFFLGKCAEAMKRYEEAEKHFTEVLERDPSDKEAALSLATSLSNIYRTREDKNTPEAEELIVRIKEILEHLPKHPLTYITKGAISLNLGNPHDALEQLETAKSMPLDEIIWENKLIMEQLIGIANILIGIEKLEEAKREGDSSTPIRLNTAEFRKTLLERINAL